MLGYKNDFMLHEEHEEERLKPETIEMECDCLLRF
jgi:hypothetical protein